MTTTQSTGSRIVVGVDGSEPSRLALRWGAFLAAPLAATVDAIIAWQLPVTYGWAAPQWDPRAEMTAVLNESVHAVFGDRPPVPIRAHAREGGAARVLIEASHGAHMLIVGSRGHGGFVGLLIGSVSASVAEHAACPVLVVHGDQDRPGRRESRLRTEHGPLPRITPPGRPREIRQRPDTDPTLPSPGWAAARRGVNRIGATSPREPVQSQAWTGPPVDDRHGTHRLRKGEQPMPEQMYYLTTPEIAHRRKELAPGIHDAFEAFSHAVFAEGALPEKTKQLIAVAVAHTTQCPYCIQGHTRLAHRKGARDEEIMEAIWVAAEMRAGGAYAHSTLALHALAEQAPA